MFEAIVFLVGVLIGGVAMYLIHFPKKVGTLLFHNPESMIAELDYPVEDIYKHNRVMLIVSRR